MPTPAALHIRLLQASDAPRYRTLMLEAYELAADAFTSTAQERASEPASFWTRRIADATGLSLGFGAFDGEDLVGTVALEFSAKPKTRHKALVIGMYVVPAVRGRGAGQALLQAAIAAAEARPGLLRLDLTVTEGNAPAIRLYQAKGFEAFGVEPMAILTPDGFRGKVHMSRALKADERVNSRSP
jgi:RimJ/RimL family protein N-acetyltransferase